MNCKTFNRLLPGYLYGESSIEEGEKVLSHARTCPDCRRLLDEMTGTISLLREEAKPHFSGGEMAALRMRVKQEIAGMDHSPARSPVRPRLSFFSRSEEHTSELQSHSFISYAVFCLKKKNKNNTIFLIKVEHIYIDLILSRAS